jgi:hypothetical protein
MSTKKLRYFEYAGYVHVSKTGSLPRHIHHAFDTPNGYAFTVAGSSLDEPSGASLAQTVADRIRYYLLNEVLEDPMEAVRNAIIYANGFLHVLMGKQPGLNDAELSCMCVLVKDNKVYYAWVGQVCLYLYDGKNIVPLNWELYQEEKGNNSRQSWHISFLGQKQLIAPGVCPKPLAPIDDDILLMATNGFCMYYEEKSTKKILSDSMPTHTKAARLLGKAAEDDFPAACQLIKFYNINEDVRSFAPVDHVSAHDNDSGDMSVLFRLKSISLVQLAIVILSVFALSYMVYDLFLIDPRPPTRIETTEELRGGDLDVASGRTPEGDSIREGQAVTSGGDSGGSPASVTSEQTPSTPSAGSIPEDIMYTVKGGDTWGLIYREFGVCSWFIRNHPPNTGKLDASNNPMAGSQLAIPVIYSSKQSLNPEYYQEFSASKVGGSCQHVNNQFLRSFEQKIRATR